MSIYRRSAVWVLGSLALALPQPGLASHVQIFERSSELNIGLDPVDGSRALYDALDVAVEHTPPYCPPEDACQPGYDTKTVSRGQILFYCQVYTDPPMQGYSVCALRGNYGPESISFDLSGDAAATTARALEVVGNPYQSSDGFVTLSCDSSTHCLVQANAITEYWLDHGNFFFDQHQYYSYGRSFLWPFFVNDSARAFYEIFNVFEEVRPGDIAIKRLSAGNLHIDCYRAIASYYVYRYRCNCDVPVQDGPLSWPVDVTSTLDGAAASALYDALDIPGPPREFHTGDGLYSDEDLYSFVCTPDHCDLRIRRPPLN